MQFDYVFGDLQVSLTLNADNETLFGKLSDGEMQALGQWLYLALNCFSNAKALSMLDLVDKDKIRGS